MAKEKNKAGRPTKEFTEEQIKQIEEMALHQCRFNTISEALDIPVNTLKRHFGRLCSKKRAEGKAMKLKQQFNDKTPTMLVWFGKQHLEQTDKRDVTSGGEEIKFVVNKY